MITHPIHYQSIQEIQDSYKNKTETPVSVTEHFLKRIESLDPDLKSYATVMSESALKQAEFLGKLDINKFFIHIVNICSKQCSLKNIIIIYFHSNKSKIIRY